MGYVRLVQAGATRSAVFEPKGERKRGRRVFIVFTLRRKGDEVLVRPISARYMHKKEIQAYEEENPGIQDRPRGSGLR